MSHTPAFSTALLRAKTAYNAQATREGRPMIGEHDLEEAVWAAYELLRAQSAAITTRDLARAAEAWRASAPPGMEDLLDAKPLAERPQWSKGKGKPG